MTKWLGVGAKASTPYRFHSRFSSPNDVISRLTGLTQNLTGTAGDLTLAFTHNPASQIASSTRSNDAYACTGHGNVTRGYAMTA